MYTNVLTIKTTGTGNCGVPAVHTDKSKVKISQNFVAFSECMKFTKLGKKG